MSQDINKHGLSRYIREDIKRLIRQRDGYGCVVCGCAIYDYEHIDPEFKDATEHNPDGIILLCDTCHRKKDKFLSIATIRKAAKSPFCRQNGFSWGPFDWGDKSPEIHIGKLICRDTTVLIRIFSEDVLCILPPDTEGGPFRINANLRDKEGRITLSIVENEWRPSIENWDVTTISNQITIRRASGEIVLQIKSFPGEKLLIDRIEMVHRGVIISADGKNHFTINSQGHIMTTSEMTLAGCERAVDVTHEGLQVGCHCQSVTLGQTILMSATAPFGFVQHDKWSISSAGAPQIFGRNSLCPCGSGKRYKHCHGSFQAKV